MPIKKLHRQLAGWLLFLGLVIRNEGADLKTKNVILITTDGLRWEEVFRGADEAMINEQYGRISDTNAVRARFWRPTATERRSILMPFFWSTIAREGQLLGNRDLKCDVRVSNPHHFSYPGYSEFLTGVVDPRIDSNDKRLNENTNVFEHLNTRPGFAGQTFAVVNWDVLPWVLNAPRSRLPVWSAFDVPEGTRRLEVPAILDETARRGQTLWNGVTLDTFVASAALHTLQTQQPRALYVSYGETDDWAHEGHYERYLKSAHEFDRFIGDLWRLVQSLPNYRNTTSLVIATDHGRGPAPVAWKSHGKAIADSAYIWMAVMGPDTAPLGERRDLPLRTQAQVAGTVAALAGVEWPKVVPGAASAVPEVLKLK